MPLRFHYLLGDFYAWVLRRILHYRRDVVLTNLSRSFPEKKYGEIRRIADDYYTHLGEIMAETLWFGGCKGRVDRLKKQHLCEYKGLAELRPLAQKGAMVLASHFGNWELIGGLSSFTYEDDYNFDYNRVCIVHKALGSSFWDAFLTDNRLAAAPDFKGYVETNDMLDYCIAHRNDGIVYVFITDQYPYKGYAQWDVPDFMHQKTSTALGGASIARKFKLPVLYMSMKREGRGRYVATFPVICEDASKLSATEIMAKYYALLEEDLNADPANYLWSHKRWK